MNRNRIKQLNDFAKDHLTRILVLAVLLTSVFSMKYVAYGKYASWLQDYTQAVAQDFHFASDSLKATPKQNNISSWITSESRTYKLPIEIRNYENSLLWNDEGTNLFYYVDAQIYSDEGLTTQAPHFAITPVYPTEAAIGTYKGHKVACIKGMSDYDKKAGLNSVAIQLTYEDNIDLPGICHMKVTAYSIPFSEIDEIEFNPSADGTKSADEMKAEYTDVLNGNIYYGELSAIYHLGTSNASGVFSSDINQNSNEYLIRLYVRSAFNTAIKIYYDPKVLVFSATEGFNDITEVYEYEDPVSGEPATWDARYVTFEFKMEKAVQFFKQGNFLAKNVEYALSKSDDPNKHVMSFDQAMKLMMTPLEDRDPGAFYPDIYIVVPEQDSGN